MVEEKRTRLVNAICRAYDKVQLDAVVRSALKNRLEYYAIERDLLATVEKLLDELDPRTHDLWTLLIKMKLSTRRPELRAAIDAYLGIEHLEANVYEALIVLEEPFVNRHDFRHKLHQLLKIGDRRVLLVRGVKLAGKSHSRWLIQRAAEHNGIKMVHIKLPRNTVTDIVGELINRMKLPPREFRDRLALPSTITKGFVSALQGATSDAELERWCLVFDGYDRDDVTKDVRDFVDVLLDEVPSHQLASVLLVVLGYNNVLPGEFRFRVLEEQVLPMTRPDVEQYFCDLPVVLNTTVAQDYSTKTCDWIFEGLPQPLDQDGILTMVDRLREKVADLQDRK